MSTTQDQSSPILTLCIPTFNRPDILDFGLERAQAIEKFGRNIEIVVSDNNPTEGTAKVIEKHRKWKPGLKYCLQTVKRVQPYVGYINAIRNATGRYVVYLADDDEIIPEALLAYADQMDADPKISAIFTDWIAYDDEQEKEIHRYFNLDRSYRFGPSDPLALVNFILTRRYCPDMGIYRRQMLLQCDCLLDRGVYQFHLWLYQMSRLGDITFESTPFYHENRVLKKRFVRNDWNNMVARLEFIGDELRNALETILLWAIQDAGGTHVQEAQLLVAKRLIDDFLNAKLTLEINRAIAAKNWLLALALRRRMILWYGPGTLAQQQSDMGQIALPAALHAVFEMTQSLSDVKGLVLEGFTSGNIGNFFKLHYPQLTVLAAPAEPPADGRYLYLVRDTPAAAGNTDGYRFYLDQLMRSYRLNSLRADLTQM